MKPLRIGINALYLIPGGVGGTEVYLRALLNALAALGSPHEFVVFVNQETGTALVPSSPNFLAAPQSLPARIRPARILWEQTVLPWQARTRSLDVMLNPGFTAPLLASCPNVTVFHDLQHVRHPEFFRWWDLPFWNFLLAGAVRRSRLLIAVSDNTRRDLMDHYQVPAGRLRLVHHGVDQHFFGLPRAPRPGALLTVATLHPHKNLDRLIRVFARLRQEIPHATLTLAGMRGHFAATLDSLIASLDLGQSARITGWLSREDLYAEYARADACVLPSRFEGFGMPLVEGLAAGIPTACSSIEPLRSLAGDAAVLFHPEDEEEMLQALRTVLTDQPARQRLSLAAIRRGQQFSWAATAQETLDALVEAAARR